MKISRTFLERRLLLVKQAVNLLSGDTNRPTPKGYKTRNCTGNSNLPLCELGIGVQKRADQSASSQSSPSDAIFTLQPCLLKAHCSGISTDIENGKWKEDDIGRFEDGHPEAGQPNGLVKEEIVFQGELLLQSTQTDAQHHRIILDGLRFCLRQVGQNSAMDLFLFVHLPNIVQLQLLAALVSFFFTKGITAVHTNEADLWHQYRHLAETNQLPIRVFYCPFLSTKDSGNFPRPGEKHGQLLSSDRVKVREAIQTNSNPLFSPLMKTITERIECQNNCHLW